MGYSIGKEPWYIITTREKVSRVDEVLSKSLSPQELNAWRKSDRQYFIMFGKKYPNVHEWRVMKNKPQKAIKVITGYFTDAYLVQSRNYLNDHILKLYVVVKKVRS